MDAYVSARRPTTDLKFRARGSVTLSGDVNDPGACRLGLLGTGTWNWEAALLGLCFGLVDCDRSWIGCDFLVFPACYAEDWWGLNAIMEAFLLLLVFLVLWPVSRSFRWFEITLNCCSLFSRSNPMGHLFTLIFDVLAHTTLRSIHKPQLAILP